MTRSFVLVLIALTPGCASSRLTSELRAWKLPSDGSLEWDGGRANGVPFQMTRASFVLREVQATDANGNRDYELSMEAIPDPHQRYSVNLDPGAFTNVTFRTDLDASGRLTTFNATGTDQFVPLLRSIGTFAVALVTAGTGVAARPGRKGIGGNELRHDGRRQRRRLATFGGESRSLSGRRESHRSRPRRV